MTHSTTAQPDDGPVWNTAMKPPGPRGMTTCAVTNSCRASPWLAAQQIPVTGTEPEASEGSPSLPNPPAQGMERRYPCRDSSYAMQTVSVVVPDERSRLLRWPSVGSAVLAGAVLMTSRGLPLLLRIASKPAHPWMNRVWTSCPSDSVIGGSWTQRHCPCDRWTCCLVEGPVQTSRWSDQRSASDSVS